MFKYALVFIALFALQGCLAKPKAESVEKDHLKELAQNVEDLSKKVGESLGIQDLDAAKIQTAVNDNTKLFLDSLTSFIDKVKIEGQAHKGDVDAVVKSAQEKLTAVAADLKKAAGPGAAQKAEEVKLELNKAYKAAADQVQQLVKTYEPEAKGVTDNIQKYSKTLLENLQTIGKSLEDNVNKAVVEHEKTHKH